MWECYVADCKVVLRRTTEKEDLEFNRFPHAEGSFQILSFWHITGRLSLGLNPEFLEIQCQ
jgi:hypothetical protein